MMGKFGLPGKVEVTMKQDGCIQTYQGHHFNILKPDIDDIDIIDIAHSLSMLCRYGGHCRAFYSVAQHSYYASWMVRPEKALAALLHDLTEAYMVDVPRPMKALLPDYKTMELNLGGHIALAFGLPVNAFEDDEIKAADTRLMALEAAVLVTRPELVWEWAGGRPDGSLFDIDPNFHSMPPEFVEKLFLTRFMELRT